MATADLFKAIRLAVKWHEGQLRDGIEALPYVTHPIEVMTLLRDVGGVTDPNLLAAAVLHDVVEESGASFGTLTTEFGPAVSDLVATLTREELTAEFIARHGLSKDQVWQVRADRLLAEIASMNSDSQAIKLADRLSNVRQAIRVKKGVKLARYIWQTVQILTIIPREVNPHLWDAIQDSIGEFWSLEYSPVAVPTEF
ncbi:MAG: HD domain-containing protein [Fimbriimonas sp.]